MKKPLVIVVHGIGEHTADSIKKTVVDACNYSLNSYPWWTKHHKGETIEDHVDIVGIGYDDIFEKERDNIAQNADRLKEILTSAFALPNELVEQLSKADEDNFFTTHALDFMLYAGLHCEIVRMRVAKEIARLLGKRNGRDVHIIGHSMGTAVLNDTIHKMYGGGIVDEKGAVHKLTPALNGIQSLWMFANFSQAFKTLNPLKTNIDPHDSLAKPSKNNESAVRKYFNVTHKYDIARLLNFEPKLGDGWVSNDVYLNNYLFTQTEALITSLNPHSLFAYIIDPKIRDIFLRTILPSGIFNIPHKEIQEIHGKVIDKVSEAKVLGKKLGEIDSPKDFVAWIKLIVEYQKTIDAMKKYKE